MTPVAFVEIGGWNGHEVSRSRSSVCSRPTGGGHGRKPRRRSPPLPSLPLWGPSGRPCREEGAVAACRCTVAPQGSVAGEAEEEGEEDEQSPPAFILAHYEALEMLRHERRVKKHRHRKTLPADEEDATPRPECVQGPFTIELGLHRVEEIYVHADGVSFLDPRTEPATTPPFEQGADGGSRLQLSWSDLVAMTKKSRTGAYVCEGPGRIDKVAAFSEQTQRALSLLPIRHGVPPTVVVGGFGMHRIKSSDPGEDTRSKMKALGRRPYGRVLDVCTGLGYTAIALAEYAEVDSVFTIELDPAMTDIQECNPWSRALFRNPKIHRIVGDATDVLPTLEDRSFDFIVHDPPAQAMSGELYSTELYQQLRRVLRGTLYHYIGDPDSKESGRLFRGVMERLQAVGFKSVKKAREAYGVVAK